MSTRRAQDPSRFLKALTIVVAVSLTASIAVLVVLRVRAGGEVVQDVELEHAGQQRRLSERVALDVERLVGNPEDSDARTEVVDIVARLSALRHGLLDGDDTLGLDGHVPDDFRRLYSPAGLDLTERLAQYEAAALDVAAHPDDPAADSVKTVRAEARDRRLVLDLDQVVDALRADVHEQNAADDSLVTAGVIGLVLLSLVCLGVLALTSRRLRRQFQANQTLTDAVGSSEALYRSTVDSLLDGVVVQDQDGRVVRMNDAALHMLTDGMKGRLPGPSDNFGDFLPPLLDEAGDPLAHGQRPAVRALLHDETVSGQIIGIKGQQQIRWYRCSAVPTAPLGSPDRHAVLSFTDITAERRLESELAEEQRRFRLALEHAPIGVAVVDESGHFVEVNQPLCDMTGRSRLELLASSFRDITHPDDLESGADELRAMAEDRIATATLEMRYVRSDGEVVDVLLAVAAARSIYRRPYYIAHIVDIGEQKRAEAAQAAALERMTELDAAKTALVSTVSHELRTPLTSVIGYLELLADEELDDRQREMVAVAARNGERLLSMIEDLLTLSGLDAGRIHLRLEPTDARRLADGVVQSLAPLAETAGVTLLRHDDGTPEDVLGDPARLERVLVNLVGNAIKFTPEGGQVNVTVRAADGGVDLEVRDTGTGIAEDEQDKLFTRFYRTAAAQADAVPGTGLGLAIAAEIVERHGGTIHLASVLGEGTTVTVHLPIDGVPADDAGQVRTAST